MSANPQWNSSLYSPKSTVPSSLLGFGYNGSGVSVGGSGGLQSSSSTGGFSNFPSFTGNGRSGSGSGNFFPSQQQPSPFSMNSSSNGQGGGSTSPTIGHFHIGTFNANSAFGEEPVKTGTTAALGNGNLHHHREGTSPSNLGSRETGIIEKLLVRHDFLYLCEQLFLSFFFQTFSHSIPMGSSNAVNARPGSFFILVSLTAILNT